MPKRRTMKIQQPVYLDISFITDTYETFTGKPVPVKIVKSESINGGISALGINAGASSHEAKEFPFSAQTMFLEMRKELESLPTIQLDHAENDTLPEYFWTRGIFAVGSSQVTRKKEVIHRDSYYRLYPPAAKKKGLYLLTSDTYFSAGYDQVLRHLHGASRGFGINVLALVKMLALQQSNHWPLCAPLIIEKLENG